MDKSNVEAYIAGLLREIEGGCLREGIVDTPNRIYRALGELFDGYDMDIDSLFKSFDGEGMDQLVLVRDIPFTSMCEHHLLIFSGLAHVAYLPNGCAIGASKIPRLVLAYAHRLQLQERIAEQVANTLMDKLNPKGVAVIIQAQHDCMQCRGVKSVGSSLVTSIMLGHFRDNPTLRSELLSLLSITGSK